MPGFKIYILSQLFTSGFEYRIDGGSPLPVASSPITLTGVTDGSYSVEVRAVNSDGSSAWSSVDTYTVDAVLDPPVGVVTIGTINVTDNDVTIPFTYSDTDQTGFEYRIDGGTPISIGSSPISLTGVTNGTYNVEVRAINNDGNGAWSAVDTYTVNFTPVVPGLPAYTLNKDGNVLGNLTGIKPNNPMYIIS